MDNTCSVPRVTCDVTCLVEEEKAAGHVTLEEELQIVQHGRVGEHEVHQLVAHQAAQLGR